MLFLLIVILSNTLLSVIFKLFPTYKIDRLQAIVFNYWTCVITGSVFMGRMPINIQSVHATWFPYALAMGISFITIFNLIAYSTRVNGITTTTIANKLSLVIPATISFILYSDHINAFKILGIALALPAVYLTSHVKDKNDKPAQLSIPILLFFLSGLLDSFVKYVEHHFLSARNDQATFTILSFGTAAVIGSLVVIVLTLTGKMKLQGRNIIAGVCIGVPNYFSIYLLIRLLNSNIMDSSSAIPVVNIGVVVTSTLTAFLLFKEKLTLLRIIGLILAIVAIVLIAFHGRSI